MFHFLPPPLHTLVPFILVLGVLVFIHELGHYLAARWRGVYVEAFSIGFGKPILRWRDRSGTDWRLSWLPLGGYVKLHGQERPEDATAETRAAWQPGRTFHEKSVGSRAIVIAAGPVANFILAAVLFGALFMTAGQPVMLSVVGEVQAGSAASRAGLQTGDHIDRIDGRPIPDFEALRAAVSAHPDATLSIDLHRGDTAMTIQVLTDSREVGGQRIGTLGITSRDTEYHRLPPGRAVVAGVAQTWDVSVQTIAGLWQMISGQRGTDDLGGPVRIAQLSGEVADLGLASLVTFMAVLSVNLGLINLFPVPVLDGGHLMFYAIEAVRGRPLPSRAIEFGFRAGFALLAALFVFATFNDLSHLGLVSWFHRQFGPT